MTIEEFDTILTNYFPVRAADGRFELAAVEAVLDASTVMVTLRSIVFDVHDGQRMLRDIKEQQVNFGHEMNLTMPDRYEAFLAATTEIVAACPIEFLETALPIDLVDASVTELKSVRDKLGFIKALSAQSRMGQHLS